MLVSNPQKTILVIGPSRSGKSELAEVLAAKTHQSVTYIATAQIDENDREWQTRILKHQQRRPAAWKSLTASTDLSSSLKQASNTECLLIDSLGTWVANFIESEESEWQQVSDRFLSSLQTTAATVIMVGEETGWGVVPAYPMGRLFRDRLGNLSRRVANLADTTYLVTGGHVINLSVLGEPLNNYGI
ncbi:MAG: bifunctional adenosylcobinamide kinase/adenosylcobinamide-phosphate guanylyltransferase [Cyanobacteria bacterium J06631_2]